MQGSLLGGSTVDMLCLPGVPGWWTWWQHKHGAIRTSLLESPHLHPGGLLSEASLAGGPVVLHTVASCWSKPPSPTLGNSSRGVPGWWTWWQNIESYTHPCWNHPTPIWWTSSRDIPGWWPCCVAHSCLLLVSPHPLLASTTLGNSLHLPAWRQLAWRPSNGSLSCR